MGIMVRSDFRPEVEMRPFRAGEMHQATHYCNSSFIVDLAMGQIPRYRMYFLIYF